MAVLIDTGVIVDAERGRARIDQVAPDEGRAISVITVSELLHGAARADAGRRATRRAFVEHLLGAFDAIPVTQAVARVHAEIWAELVRCGELIGAHDLWIAATAIAHGLGVVTTDVRDFARVPGLRLVGVTG